MQSRYWWRQVGQRGRNGIAVLLNMYKYVTTEKRLSNNTIISANIVRGLWRIREADRTF